MTAVATSRSARSTAPSGASSSSARRDIHVGVQVRRRTHPERGFWQVESSSLHDFPQQFRTFEIYLNSDYTVSVVTVNVDPAVAPGTPAAKSREYAVAAQQMVNTDLHVNNHNFLVAFGNQIASGAERGRSHHGSEPAPGQQRRPRRSSGWT